MRILVTQDQRVSLEHWRNRNQQMNDSREEVAEFVASPVRFPMPRKLRATRVRVVVRTSRCNCGDFLRPVNYTVFEQG